MIKKLLGHTKTIIKHKWIVFKLACKAGIPWRGFVHDLSKFSPTEFLEGVKYFAGTHSPITEAKKSKGYSEAWLHHKGRNKNHLEYWIDFDINIIVSVIPYKYVVEKVCDDLSAGIVYCGKNWTKDVEYNYYMMQRERVLVNPKTDKFLIDVYSQVKENGIEKTITKKNLKQLYKKHCIDDKNNYKYVRKKGVWEIV